MNGAPAFLDFASLRGRLAAEEARAVKSTETRPFWCIAVEEWNPADQEWEIALSYTHADDEAAAWMNFVRGRCDVFGRILKPYRKIGVARVVGFKAKDDNGDHLVA